MTPDLAEVHDARHHLTPGPDARESLAFVLDLPEEGIGVIAYTWVNGSSQAGCALAVFGPGVGDEPVFEVVDGVPVPSEQGFDAWEVGPITVRHGKPLVEADVTFAGEGASLTYRFEALHPAYNYGASPAGCAWYLAEDRFEQAGRVRGTLRVGGRTIDYETTGHRDHSWGTRNWTAIQHWKWVLVQTPAGDAAHVMEATGLGHHQVVGYVWKDGAFAEVTGISGLDFDLRPDLMHTALVVDVDDDAGRRTELRFEAAADFVFPVSPVCTMHEVAMRASMDGVAGPGHVEMGWPRDFLERAQADPGVAAHTAGRTRAEAAQASTR